MKRRSWLIIAAGVFGLLVLLVLVALAFPRQILTVDDGPVKADALVVLGGFASERPQRAAELFKAGAAPKIILCGIGDGLVNLQLLKKSGVPENVIQLEDRSISTFENAKFSIPLLRQLGAHKVIIVTSWYHSRRALATFRHLAPDLQFYSRPAYLGYASKDQPMIGGYIRWEYPKIIYYWLWHGVWSF